MSLATSIIAELQHEAATTRKLLERVPESKLLWKPHQKCRTLGEIATHIANLPGLFIASLDKAEFDRNSYNSATEGVSDILALFDKNIYDSIEKLQTLSDQDFFLPWRYKYGEKVIFEMPRLAVLRAMGLSHIIHHRGQLSVYLRLLNIAVPSIYGPSADEP